MKTNISTLALALGFILSGLFAYIFPSDFFTLLPDYYGDFNSHFVKDAGISFFSSGSLFALSLCIKKWQLPLTIGATFFVFLHSLFHVEMLISGMAPTFLDMLLEVIVIVSPGFLALFLTLIRVKQYSQSNL